MKFVLACWGSRGDVEPVSPCRPRTAAPRARRVHGRRARPDSASSRRFGLRRSPTESYWSESMKALRELLDVVSTATLGGSRISSGSRLDIGGVFYPVLDDMSRTLMSLVDGADLLLTGQSWEEQASSVAEYYDIPLATLHYFPMRPNGQTLHSCPRR